MDAIAVQSGHEDSADPLRYITNEELRGFYLISPWRIAIDTTITWATVFGAIWLWAVTANAASYALAFFLIATRQHALNTFVHEAAHFNISRKKWWNDFLSDVLYATPHLINTDSYRGKHLEHHKHLGDHNRDQEFKARYVIRGTRFLRYSVTTLSGWGLLHAVRSYVPSLSDRRAPRRRYVLLVALTNGLLFAYCWAVRAPWAFLTLWLLPLFTLTLYISMLRVISEHQSESYATEGKEIFDADIKPAYTRTIAAGPAERYVFSPLNFCYHNEHHWFPAVPYTQLPRLHRLLLDRGYYSANPGLRGDSYVAVIKSLVLAKEPAFTRRSTGE